MGLTLLEGNEAIAWASVDSGCRFFAGYPITPATTIYTTMLKLLPPMGGICLQGEDEIASIGFCLGASMAGMKVMTATSGPGISLYSEQISFAIGSEIPIVIVDVQRLGPSTGSATKGADGDIQFLRWGNSGGLPVIVLTPMDVRDCFELTRRAFNLAETYRCPVFLALNKEVSMTRETIDTTTLDLDPLIERTRADSDQPFFPFGTSGNTLTPAFLPLGGKRLVRTTSSTHGPDGYITTEAAQIGANQERLLQKIESNVHKFTFFDQFTIPGADTLVITYGVTARAAMAAVQEAAHSRHKADLLVLKTLWPVPSRLIQEKAHDYRRVVVAEMNLGQYLHEIRQLLPGKPIDFIGRMNGELLTPGLLGEVLRHE